GRAADRRADGDTTWVGVLDDPARRKRELACQKSRSRKVVHVVEGQRLAVQLLDAGQQMSTSAALGVVGGALMWILPVREVEHLLQGDDDRLGERLSLGEPRRDGGLVRRGRGERLR